MINPNIPIILITNKSSLNILKELGLVDIYDDVITNIYDDYPYERIVPTFTSAPKIWAISKLKTPFAILDTDLVYSRPFDELQFLDFAYLYKETSNVYPRPFEVSVPNNFNWDLNMINYFRVATPINCGVLYFNNDIFKNEFVKNYFNFVLDNEGKVINISDDLLKNNILIKNVPTSYISPSAVNMFSENFLLAAIIEKHMNTDYSFRVGQILPIIFNSVFFNNFSLEENRKTIQEMINESYYQLGIAKHYINNDECNCKLPKLAEMIITSGKELLNNGNCWDKYGHIYERYKNEIIQSLQTVDNSEDTKK